MFADQHFLLHFLHGQTLQAIFCLIFSKEQKLWGSPQFEFTSLKLIEKRKRKNEFLLGSEGNKWGEGREMLCNAFDVFAKQIFHWHQNFNFGINTVVAIPKIMFANNFFHKGIGLNFWMWIWMICLMASFYVPSAREDMQLTARTCYKHMNEKMHKIWPTIRFCPRNFQTCPCPKNLSETCPGPFQITEGSIHSKEASFLYFDHQIYCFVLVCKIYCLLDFM